MSTTEPVSTTELVNTTTDTPEPIVVTDDEDLENLEDVTVSVDFLHFYNFLDDEKVCSAIHLIFYHSSYHSSYSFPMKFIETLNI